MLLACIRLLCGPDLQADLRKLIHVFSAAEKLAVKHIMTLTPAKVWPIFLLRCKQNERVSTMADACWCRVSGSPCTSASLESSTQTRLPARSLRHAGARTLSAQESLPATLGGSSAACHPREAAAACHMPCTCCDLPHRTAQHLCGLSSGSMGWGAEVLLGAALQREQPQAGGNFGEPAAWDHNMKGCLASMQVSEQVFGSFRCCKGQMCTTIKVTERERGAPGRSCGCAALRAAQDASLIS